MPNPSNSELSERQRAWLEHLRACRSQGLSLKAYAEQQGLNLQRFRKLPLPVDSRNWCQRHAP